MYDILITLDQWGILTYVENLSVVLAIAALWECVKFQWEVHRGR